MTSIELIYLWAFALIFILLFCGYVVIKDIRTELDVWIMRYIKLKNDVEKK